MTEAATRLRNELSRLSVEERAEMAYILIESLDAGTETDVEEAWDAELARRAADVRNATAKGEASESVFSRVRGNIT